MKKLFFWATVAVVFCGGSYFTGLLLGLPLQVAVYFPAAVIGIMTMILMVSVGKNAIFTTVAPVFSAALLVFAFFAEETIFSIILSSVSVLFFAASATVAKVVIATEKIQIKYKWIFFGILAEWVIVFVILKYGYLIIPR